MPSRNSQRLELTWFNKDKALIPSERGRYGYEWVDPRDPRYCEVHTLVETGKVEGIQVEKDDSKQYSPLADLEPTTGNLLIHGDSGDVLEALHHVPELANEYVGQVRLCVIDPPFNTAKSSFKHYDDNLEHSIWLTMMRDRLVHIHKLLSSDGSIWVHLDDSESHRMRTLLDEVFGPGNFVADIAWRANDSSSNNAGGFSKDRNSILVYGKKAGWKPEHLPDPTKQGHYKNPDNDPRGPWYDGRDIQNPKDRPNLKYQVMAPNGIPIDPPNNGWRWEWETLRKKMETGEVYFNSDFTSLKRKTYLYEQGGLPPSDVWANKDIYGSTRSSKQHLQKLFPEMSTPELFDTPKPEQLLRHIIEMSTEPGDIVLDVFGGSGSSAAVAHKMGRRWVTCELMAETFDTFTRPRLEKVVLGQDQFGITTTPVGRVDATDDGLPEGLSGDDAFALTQSQRRIADLLASAPVDLSRIVNMLIREDAATGEPALEGSDVKELRRLVRTLTRNGKVRPDLLPEVSRSINRQLKTEEAPPIVNWRGGGSFRVMALSPNVFDYDPQLGLTMLTDEAHGETLIASIAANLGFERAPDAHPFHGRKGKMRLVVTEGAVTEQVVDDVLAHLPSDERVTIAALSVPDGVRKYLRQRSRGSVIKHVPDDMFSFAGEPSMSTTEG